MRWYWKAETEDGVKQMTLSGSLMCRIMASWPLMPGTIPRKGKVVGLGITVRLLNQEGISGLGRNSSNFS